MLLILCIFCILTAYLARFITVRVNCFHLDFHVKTQQPVTCGLERISVSCTCNCSVRKILQLNWWQLFMDDSSHFVRLYCLTAVAYTTACEPSWMMVKCELVVKLCLVFATFVTSGMQCAQLVTSVEGTWVWLMSLDEHGMCVGFCTCLHADYFSA